MIAVRFAAAAAVIAAFGAIALVAAPAAPAQADATPTLTFTTAAVTAPFGGDWLVEIQVSAPEGYGTVDPAWGTVDIQLEDVPGIYSAGLPIMRGGLVYFARPTDAPLLSAGEHRATAILRPAASGLLEAATQTPLVITVTPLGLEPRIEVLEVPGDEDSPYAVLTLEGDYVEALGTPAGAWAVTVDREGTQVLQTSEAVTAGSGAVNVSLAEVTRPGTTLTVSATFTPDAAVAAGIEASDTPSQEIVTPALTPVEWLTRAIAMPWWVLGVSLLLLAGAIVAAIVVILRYRPNRAVTEGDDAPEHPEDPVEVSGPAPNDAP